MNICYDRVSLQLPPIRRALFFSYPYRSYYLLILILPHPLFVKNLFPHP